MAKVYLICIILSVILCYWYFIVDVRRSVVQNVMLLVLLIANVGYYFKAVATNLPAEIAATKITYVGACFLPLLWFLSMCEMCKVRIKPLITFLLVTLQTVHYTFVLTIGYSGLYYKTVEYVNVGGMGSLIKEYGPMHFIHPVVLCGFFAASFGIAIYTLIVKKNVERSGLALMVLFLGIAVASYVIQTALGIVYDITPILYIVLMTGALVPLYRSDTFDVVNNDQVIQEQLEHVGFLCFDSHMRYRGGNDYALSLFEELREENIGARLSKLPESLKPAYEKVELLLEDRKNIKGRLSVEGENIKIMDRTFSTEIHSLSNHFNRLVGAILEIRDITDHIKVLELTEKYNVKLESEVWEKTERIRMIQQRTILGMAQMVESRDLSTGGHIKRTSDVVRIFADRLLKADIGFTKHFLNLVIRSAPMHDLGKIGVDDAVLRKQGKFTDEEYEMMKKHSEIGGKIVTDVLSGVEEPDFVKVAFNVANYHHEKVNGKGYPYGLKGEEIPIEARIMALADVFDALVSKRCYKDAFTYDKAFSIIQEDAGVHFDAKLAPLFLECRQELEDYYNSCDH